MVKEIIKEIYMYSKMITYSWLLATYIIFTIAITMASRHPDWLIILDFNSAGEGPLELIMVYVGWLAMTIYFIFKKYF